MPCEMAAALYVDEVLTKKASELCTEDAFSGALPTSQDYRYAGPLGAVLDSVSHPGEEVIAYFFVALADIISHVFQEPGAIPLLRLYSKALVEVEVPGNFFPGCKDYPLELASIWVREPEFSC